MDHHQDNYSASFTDQDLGDNHRHHYSPFSHNTSQSYHHHHHHELLMKPPPPPPPPLPCQMLPSNNNMDHFIFNNTNQSSSSSSSIISPGFDKLMSFADVMQFADFGPKLAFNQKTTPPPTNTSTTDPVYFLKFPVLNDREGDEDPHLGMISLSSPPPAVDPPPMKMLRFDVDVDDTTANNNNNNQLEDHGHHDDENKIIGGRGEENVVVEGGKNKRKRTRSVKTSEEVESQRMTHIAVERNRRKQMNEHLRVLRSLMPGSYVQRGDQASIIGGAIEFVRELEQLLQCLESQKRRRLYGDQPSQSQRQHSINVENNNEEELMMMNLESGGGGGGVLVEEMAENKSCLADVEVKLLGLDAIIKVLSRRRPGQLIRAISALEDLQLTILHTNITTIEQTVLYSFNVKVGSEGTFTAEEIAGSVQQIFTFIHTNVGSGI
ncbi:Transcription factor FAMA [Linum grandiflorum]